MNQEQIDVKEFMLKAGQECPEKPKMPDMNTRKLRIKLIAEELLELCDAFSLRMEIICGDVRVHEMDFDMPDLTEALDATTDLKVVVIGTDVAMGIDNSPAWSEVNTSNLSKFIDGHWREDGKWMKGKSWRAPNLEAIIMQQL